MADPTPFAFSTGGDRSEQWEWLTDVMQATTGPEQTLRLRGVPRVTLSCSGQESGVARQLLETSLHACAGRDWWVPVLQDALRVSSDLPIGATNVTIDASMRRFEVGGKAMLLGELPGQCEIVDVIAFDDTGVIISETTWAWPTGALIAPAWRAVLASTPTLERFTGDVVSYELSFLSAATSASLSAADNLPIYRGFPVLEINADWSAAPQWSPDRDLMSVDYGIGTPVRADLVRQPRAKLSVAYTATGRASVWALFRLLFALAGRANPLWVPSRGHDLTAAAGATGGASTLDVAACDLVSAGPQPQRRDLRIQLRDGTILYRRVTAVTTVGSRVERLTLDSAWPSDVVVSDIQRVSYMTFARQSADINRLDWWMRDVVTTTLEFVGVADNGA